MWEAEWLDANTFLDEYLRWGPLRLHCLFILQWMFSHAVAHGRKEQDQAIHWGHQEPSPEWDLGWELPTMDLIGPGMPWAEIRVIYNDIYQMRRSPRRSPCNEEAGERIHQEILDTIKEGLWCRWVSAQPDEELKQTPTGPSKTDAQTEFQAKAHATYNHKNMRWDPCKEALAIARDPHWQVLVAIALLEENIEWLSCYVTHGWSGCCQCSGSCQCLGSCRKSQLAGHQKQVSSAVSHNGDPVKRCTQSPSPTQPRWWVIFAESSLERDMAVQELHPSAPGMEHMSDWSQPVEGDLGCPPSLDLQLEDFLGEEMPPLRLEWGESFQWQLMPKPSLNDSSEWVTLQAKQIDTPSWWPELSMVPRESDVKSLPGRSGPHSNCLRGGVMPWIPPMITPFLLPLTPWIGISSSWLGIYILEARIIDWSSQRRPWPMQRPSSTGLKKSSPHTQASLADWWKVYCSCAIPWNHWQCSWMRMCWETPPWATGWVSSHLGWQNWTSLIRQAKGRKTVVGAARPCARKAFMTGHGERQPEAPTVTPEVTLTLEKKARLEDTITWWPLPCQDFLRLCSPCAGMTCPQWWGVIPPNQQRNKAPLEWMGL